MDPLYTQAAATLAAAAPPQKVLIGLDGFIDTLFSVVDQRLTPHSFQPLEQIEELGKRIGASAHKSTNLELVAKEKKIGGNAPLMAQALAAAGGQVTLCAALGDEEVHSIFLPLQQTCQSLYHLAAPGISHALEFQDGKIILGELSSVTTLNWASLTERVPISKWKTWLENMELIAMVNWTMIHDMTEIWKELLSHSPRPTPPCKKRFFVDLADPAKRSNEELDEALQTLKKWEQKRAVTLGLNQAEAIRVCSLLELPPLLEQPESAQRTAQGIREALSLSQVVIHATKFACGATCDEQKAVLGPYTSTPYMTTGAGDHFNGGYCAALLEGCSLEESLVRGVGTSGFYVRQGKSPNRKELQNFLISFT